MPWWSACSYAQSFRSPLQRLMWLFCPQLLAPSPLLTLLVTLCSWSLHSSSGSLYLWFLLELHSLSILRVGSSTFFQSHFHGGYPSWPSMSKQNNTVASLPLLSLHFLALDLVYASLGTYAPQSLTSRAAYCLFVTCMRMLPAGAVPNVYQRNWVTDNLSLPSFLCSLYAFLFAACAHCTLPSLSVSSATGFSVMFVPLFTYWTLFFFFRYVMKIFLSYIPFSQPRMLYSLGC